MSKYSKFSDDQIEERAKQLWWRYETEAGTEANQISRAAYQAGRQLTRAEELRIQALQDEDMANLRVMAVESLHADDSADARAAARRWEEAGLILCSIIVGLLLAAVGRQDGDSAGMFLIFAVLGALATSVVLGVILSLVRDYVDGKTGD